MAALATRVTLTVRDRHLNEARIIFHVAAGIVDPNNAGVQAIVTAINACINAVGITIELSQVNAVTGSPTSAVAYIMVDKAGFRGLDQDAQPHNWRVPGPKAAIFLSNTEDVDMANSDVAAWTTAVTTYALGRGGATITSVPNGHRLENRKPLKR